jgi:demethylmenaquinone methyltransferase / 2-methoxy-6-polyprenyl-1,4-benzoquinol methylase
MFDEIAERYDLLNRLMSLGLDGRWRRRLLQACGTRPERVLDVATGTADVALALAKAHPEAQITGLDPSPGMLASGREKVVASEAANRVSLVLGDAQQLPFNSNTFDAVSIAFGIRNVPDRLQGLREMARVTKPGGTVAILELGEPRRGFLAPLARLHIRHVVPTLGAWISGAAEYRYLARSVAAFPEPDTFVELMAQAGLEQASATALSFGVVHLYQGIAPKDTQ